MSDTTDTVKASIEGAAGDNPEALAAAVQQRNDAPAPPSEFAQFMHEARRRFEQLEGFVKQAGPLIAAIEPLVASTLPGGSAMASVVDRLGALEGFASDLLGAFDAHFSGKIDLPAAPDGTAENTPSAMPPAPPA